MLTLQNFPVDAFTKKNSSTYNHRRSWALREPSICTRGLENSKKHILHQKPLSWLPLSWPLLAGTAMWPLPTLLNAYLPSTCCFRALHVYVHATLLMHTAIQASEAENRLHEHRLFTKLNSSLEWAIAKAKAEGTWNLKTAAQNLDSWPDVSNFRLQFIVQKWLVDLRVSDGAAS